MRKLLKLDYRHYICITLTLIFLLLAIFYFRNAHIRIFESFKDLYTSFIYYIAKLFEFEFHNKITINEFSKTPLKLPFNLPNTWEEFKLLWSNYWMNWISIDNFKLYFNWIGDFLYKLSKFIMLLLPFLILIIILFNRQTKINNDYNKDSKPLKIFKKFEKKLYLPIKYWLLLFIRFVKENSMYLKLWCLIWAYNFNFITIFVEFIAYYLFFISSFKLTTLYIQVLKLLIDLSVVIGFIPSIGWLMITLLVINIIRKNIGYSRLNHLENRDRGFINERPIVLMLCGTMGSKKTTIITDIALSQEIMLRNKAFEKILETDLKFPFFPWINLENSLKRAIDNHSVYNLATCKRFVKSKMIKFYKKPCKQNIFMYDYKRYSMLYDDNLKVIDIWEAIKNYCQLYFVYIIQSSLIISNYSIRTDNLLNDLGNFPLWNAELFKRDSRMIDAYSRHAHILDFDSLRLGKKVLQNNPKADSFEFGVINITEIGKERGNNLELLQVKKNDDSANQKNDLFNSWLKMVRHSATIDNYPFVKIITDEQRPESWGADARDLLEIVHIQECSNMKLSMPLFALEDFLIQLILNKFIDRYYKYRFERGDNTLFMYLYHGLISMLNNYHKRIYNTFGYYKLDVEVEKGTLQGKTKNCNYYLMFKKIYSRRFSTDCFSDFFHEKALRSKIGINDLSEFRTEKATFDEMLQENSYFFNELTKNIFIESFNKNEDMLL